MKNTNLDVRRVIFRRPTKAKNQIKFMQNIYHRFWFELDLKNDVKYPWNVVANYGVTALHYKDAINILQQKIFIDIEMPKIKKCIEDIDIRQLDQNHVTPNMNPPISRGIWYPMGYQ